MTPSNSIFLNPQLANMASTPVPTESASLSLLVATAFQTAPITRMSGIARPKLCPLHRLPASTTSSSAGTDSAFPATVNATVAQTVRTTVTSRIA